MELQIQKETINVKKRIGEKNKKVLSLCPNFDKIINADFSHNDGISKRLVKIYKDFMDTVVEYLDKYMPVEK